jgi:hypothetical protein
MNPQPQEILNHCLGLGFYQHRALIHLYYLVMCVKIYLLVIFNGHGSAQ